MTLPKNPPDQKTEISPEPKGFPNATPFKAVQNKNQDTDTSMLKKNRKSGVLPTSPKGLRSQSDRTPASPVRLPPAGKREREKTTPTEANLNRDVDFKSEAKKSNPQLPNETREKGGVSTGYATFERPRPEFLILTKYREDLANCVKEVLLNKEIPMDDQVREHDLFRYESTNLTENRDVFEINKKTLEKSVDQSARLQTGLDLFNKSISMPTYPNKRPLSTVPLAQEEKKPYLLNYLNNNLSQEEADLFEKQVLADLDYSERVYLKHRIPNESTVLKNKKHLSLSPAFDYKYMYYNRTSHYEGMAWLLVMATWFFALIAILQRKEK